MDEIGKYKLVTGRNREELNRAVNEDITRGWQPFGNPTSKDGKWGQVLVRYEAEDSGDKDPKKAR